MRFRSRAFARSCARTCARSSSRARRARALTYDFKHLAALVRLATFALWLTVPIQFVGRVVGGLRLHLNPVPDRGGDRATHRARSETRSHAANHLCAAVV